MAQSEATNELNIFRYDGISFLYMALSFLCLSITVVFTHINESVKFYYISCHGEGISTHGVMLLFLTVQAVITVLVWHKPFDSINESSRAENNLSLEEQDEAMCLSGKSVAINRRIVSNACQKHYNLERNAAGEDVSGDDELQPPDLDGRAGFCIGSEEMDEPWKKSAPARVPHRGEGKLYIPLSLEGVCWNSVWVLTIYGIFFLGLHASVLGWKFYGYISMTPEALPTCMHLVANTVEGERELRKTFISEFAFVEAFAATTSTMMVVRKFRDPSLLKNHFVLYNDRYRMSGANLLYSAQVLLQVVIISCAAAKIALAWLTGYGSPFQIISGLLLAFTSMWFISVITHVLQVDRHPRMYFADLEYHWLWMLIALAIIWFCGIIFYFSVYGVSWTAYMVPHINTWVFLILLTALRFDCIFHKASHLATSRRRNRSANGEEKAYISFEEQHSVDGRVLSSD